MTMLDPNSDGQYVELEHFGNDNIVIESTGFTIGAYYSLSCYDPVNWKPISIGINQTMRLECVPRMEI